MESLLEPEQEVDLCYVVVWCIAEWGFVVVIALLVFVVSFCKAASVSERFACVLSFLNAYSKPLECEY